MVRVFAITFGLVMLSLAMENCRSTAKPEANAQVEVIATSQRTPTPEPTPKVPNLQAELLDKQDSTTAGPIGKFDFKNHTYPLPRGWQNPDGTDEITLKDGKVDPINDNTNSKPVNKSTAKGKARTRDDEEKAAGKYGRRIGMSYVATKYFDVTGDGDDEAVVILKIETEGSAIPQIVYVYTWKSGEPELIWPFRTGDRSDGGLKKIFAEGGNLVVELFGQDRFLLGQTETGRVSDDLEQICCPTHFTRSIYKWNGKNFLIQGKRLTYLTADPTAAPAENVGDKVSAKPRAKK